MPGLALPPHGEYIAIIAHVLCAQVEHAGRQVVAVEAYARAEHLSQAMWSLGFAASDELTPSQLRQQLQQNKFQACQ